MRPKNTAFVGAAAAAVVACSTLIPSSCLGASTSKNNYRSLRRRHANYYSRAAQQRHDDTFRLLQQQEEDGQKNEKNDVSYAPANSTNASTTNEEGEDEQSSSSLFVELNDPADSNNRDDLIDMDAAVAMKLTHAPTVSPNEQPFAYDGAGGAGGPSNYDYDNDDPPYDGYGKPSNINPYDNDHPYSDPYETYPNSARSSDGSDFKEFIAFVGWYAFLIFCCLLPTVCAYYRRRRNARTLRENFLNIQSRLAEIERQRVNEEMLGNGLGGEDGDGGGMVNLNGENRDRDWEVSVNIYEVVCGSARFYFLLIMVF